MAIPLKRLLPNVETEIFRNWDDRPGSIVKATNITLCNTSDTDVKVHLGFVVLCGLFLAGAVLSYAVVPAHETITIQVSERILGVDESIRAWAEVPDVIALSIDMIGVDSSNIPTVSPAS